MEPINMNKQVNQQPGQMNQDAQAQGQMNQNAQAQGQMNQDAQAQGQMNQDAQAQGRMNQDAQAQQRNAAQFLQAQNQDLMEDLVVIDNLQAQQEQVNQNLNEEDFVVIENLQQQAADVDRVKKTWERINALNQYRVKAAEMVISGRFSRDQLRRRINSIVRVWNRIEGEENGQYNAAVDALGEILNRIPMANQQTLGNDYEMRDHLIQRGLEAPSEDGEDATIPAEKVQALQAADQWLLDAYTSKDGSLENSTIFNFLNRPKIDRLLAYYMIEDGYRTNLTEITMVHIGNSYIPNVEKLKAADLKLSRFEKVYQSANQAAPFLKALYMANDLHDQNEDLNEDDVLAEQQNEQQDIQQNEQQDIQQNEQQDIHQNEQQDIQQNEQQDIQQNEQQDIQQNEQQDIQQKIQEVNRAINDVNRTEREYKDCHIWNIVRKRSLKNNLKNHLNSLCEKVNDLMDMVIHLPGEKEITVADYIEAKVKKGKLLGTGGKSTAAIMASGFQLGGMKLVSAQSNYAGGAIGGLTGLLGMALAISAIVNTCKNFSKLTLGARANAILDVINQTSSSIYGMGSAVTGPLHAYQLVSDTTNKAVGILGGQTAAIVTAGTGIAVGGVSAGVGVYQGVRAYLEGKRGEETRTKFKNLRNVDNRDEIQQNNHELDKKIHFENNILKIQERIVKRDKITAGCQTVSGVCLMAAGTASLFAAIPGMTMVAAVSGLVGFLTGVGGSIVTRKMKKAGYQKAVDEYLDLDKLAEDQFTRMRNLPGGKEPSRSEKNKIRERLRSEMMEAYGFTSVKAFCTYIMNNYAKHICDQMRTVWEKLIDLPEGYKLEDVLTEEENAYRDLVRSLGLKISAVSNPPMPTQDMIFSKLMS